MSVSYPIKVVVRARELRAAGWSLRRVRDLVERETGRRPSLNTISYWTDSGYEQRKLARNRRRHRTFSAAGSGAGGKLGGAHHTPEFRLARMIALHHEAQLSVSAIARLMSFDYGERYSRDLVERAIVERKLPVRYSRERVAA